VLLPPCQSPCAAATLVNLDSHLGSSWFLLLAPCPGNSSYLVTWAGVGILSVCYGLSVRVPPYSYVERLMPKVMALGGDKVQESSVLMNGIGACQCAGIHHRALNQEARSRLWICHALTLNSN
jgi:hypothetical protein